MTKRPAADYENVTDDKRSAPDPLPQQRRWKRRLRWVVAVTALAACIWFCRGFILSGVGGFLVLDESDGKFNAVVILETGQKGSDRYVEAANLYRADPSRRIFLVEPYRYPLLSIPTLPARHDVGRNQLADWDVPAEAVESITGKPRNAWEAARCLRAWLQEHPDARPLILCHRFHSRYQRYVLDELLEEDASRVFVRALPGRCGKETDWWKSRSGVKNVFFGYFRLAYARCMGEGQAVSERVHFKDKPETSRRTVEETRS